MVKKWHVLVYRLTGDAHWLTLVDLINDRKMFVVVVVVVSECFHMWYRYGMCNTHCLE